MNAKGFALNDDFGISGQLAFRDAGDGFIVIDINNLRIQMKSYIIFDKPFFFLK